MEIAKKKGALLSFDPNLRLRLWKSPKVAQALIMRVWKQSNIIKVSDSEVEFLTNKDTVEDDAVMSLWHPELKLLLVTLGGKGCKYYTKVYINYDKWSSELEEQQQATSFYRIHFFVIFIQHLLLWLQDFRGAVKGIAVKPIDTTGAGDAFVGAMLRKIADDQSALQVSYDSTGV